MEVTYLSMNSIDNSAMSLLNHYGKHFEPMTDPPVPVEEICEKLLQLDIVPGDFDRDFPEKNLRGAIGALDIGEKAVYVDLANNQAETRFRFTVAHEIGHHQLHRHLLIDNPYQGNLFSALTPQSRIVCRDQDRTKPIEWQANQFAAALLMPKSLIVRQVKHLRDLWNLEDIIELPEHSGIDVVDIINHTFNVSNEAARIRLENLNIIPKTVKRAI